MVNFLKVTVIFLLLINIGTLCFIWADRAQHLPPETPADFLTRGLNLSAAQKDRYEAMRSEHHQSVEEIKQSANVYRQQLHNLLHAPATDSAQVQQLADSVGACQQKIELVTFYHFKALRKICTAEQQKKFDLIIHDALRMMAHEPPHDR